MPTPVDYKAYSTHYGTTSQIISLEKEPFHYCCFCISDFYWGCAYVFIMLYLFQHHLSGSELDVVCLLTKQCVVHPRHRLTCFVAEEESVRLSDTGVDLDKKRPKNLQSMR